MKIHPNTINSNTVNNVIAKPAATSTMSKQLVSVQQSNKKMVKNPNNDDNRLSPTQRADIAKINTATLEKSFQRFSKNFVG